MAFVKLCWFVTMAAAIVSAISFIQGTGLANGAPQQAAVAAMSAAAVIIPYIFTRSLEGLIITRQAADPAKTPSAQPVPPKGDAATESTAF